VACLLNIYIVERFIGEEDLDYERGMSLLQSELGVTEDEANDKVDNQWGGYISISHLREASDKLYHRCNELEELEMRRRQRSWRLLRPCALRRFCCFWLASLFSPKRTAKTFI
jgi:hypothetical protein